MPTKLETLNSTLTSKKTVASSKKEVWDNNYGKAKGAMFKVSVFGAAELVRISNDALLASDEVTQANIDILQYTADSTQADINGLRGEFGGMKRLMLMIGKKMGLEDSDMVAALNDAAEPTQG
jgi:hypothetical protein